MMKTTGYTRSKKLICGLIFLALCLMLSGALGAQSVRAEEGGLLSGLGDLLSLLNEKESSSSGSKKDQEEGSLGSLADLIGAIANAEIPMKEVSVSKIADQKYTGKEVRPVPKLTRNGNTLRRGTDYTLTYSDNIKAGTAKIKITGKGRYKGTKTVSFKIVKNGSSGNSSGKSGSGSKKKKTSSGSAATEGKFTVRTGKNSVVYNGKEQKPSVKVTVRGKKVPSSGYTVSYKNNKNVGTATISVKGKGDYKGWSGSATFKITLKPMAFSSASSPESGKMSLSWNKDSQADGYQIQYCTDKAFDKSVRSLVISSNATTSETIDKLSPGQKYYVRIRSFTKTSSRNSYGPFGTTRTVTVKK